MAIQWGALAAGFSEAYTRDVEDKRERKRDQADYEKKLELQDKFEQAAEERRAGRAGAERRRAEKEWVQNQTAFLKSLGLSDQDVSVALSGGKENYGIYEDAIKSAMSKGIDPATMFRLPNVEDATSFAKVTDEMPDVYGDSRKLMLDRTEFKEGVDKPEYISGFNVDAYAEAMGAAPKYESSFSARLAKLSQMKTTAPPSKLAAIEAEERILLDDLVKMKDAETERGGEATSPFGKATIETIVKTSRSMAAQDEGLRTDLETGVIEGLEGKTFKAGQIANRTAQRLEDVYGQLDDPVMAAQIIHNRQNAQSFYREHMAKTVREGGVVQIKSADFANSVQSDALTPGTVYEVKSELGGSRLVIYTGIPTMDGKPYYYNK